MIKYTATRRIENCILNTTYYEWFTTTGVIEREREGRERERMDPSVSLKRTTGLHENLYW